MMKINRGDVLWVYFPFSDGTGIKNRPVTVVQADHLKTDLPQIVIIPITSKMERAGYPSRVVLLAKNKPISGKGLKKDSVVMADKLFTIDQSLIQGKIGKINDMKPIDIALKHTLGL